MYLDSQIKKGKKFTMDIQRLAKKRKEVDCSGNFN